MAVKTNNTHSGKPLDCKRLRITANSKHVVDAADSFIHSKPCRAMNKKNETAGDRELFSELVETQIHLLFIIL